MMQGFYEQLGVDVEASVEEIRHAYTGRVAALVKRRRALVEQGGDTDAVDRARAQADDAWSVLSDPSRRRRYDAFRALQAGDWTTDPQQLWNRVAGALVHPAAAAAAELIRVSTTLSVGALPPAPSLGGPPRRARDGDTEVTLTATTVPRAPRRVAEPPSEPDEVSIPRVHPLPTPTPSLRVVEAGPAESASADVAPSGPLGPDDLRRLAQELGYSGGFLRTVREADGMSLQDMADTTRISVRYLEAIEADAHDRLPSATFVRGYVREMARLLGLDDEAVTAGYMKRFSS